MEKNKDNEMKEFVQETMKEALGKKQKRKNNLVGKLFGKTISKAVLAGSVLLAIYIGGSFFLGTPNWFHSEEGKVTTISKSSLEEVLEISELSTLEYTYNAIAPVTKRSFNSVKYYVAYEGAVTAGIDFEKIEINVNDEKKKITITVPEAEIQDVRVDAGTMKYIFVDDSYETETVSSEAYSASLDHLAAKAAGEEQLLAMAKENAIDSVNALIGPWVAQVDKEYMVVVQ